MLRLNGVLTPGGRQPRHRKHRGQERKDRSPHHARKHDLKHTNALRPKRARGIKGREPQDRRHNLGRPPSARPPWLSSTIAKTMAGYRTALAFLLDRLRSQDFFGINNNLTKGVDPVLTPKFSSKEARKASQIIKLAELDETSCGQMNASTRAFPSS